MPDFRTIVAKPVAPSAPNGAMTPTPVEKALAALEKASPGPAAPAVATEPPPKPDEAQKPAQESDQRFTQALAAERKLQQQREALAAERRKLDEERKAFETQRQAPAKPASPLHGYFSRIAQAVAEGKIDPKRGYEMLTESIIAEAPPAAEMEVQGVRQEVEGLKSQLEQDRKAREEADKQRQQQEFDQAVKDVQSEIAEHLTANKATYPYLLAALEDEADAAGNKQQPEKYVYAVMDAVYKSDLEHAEVKAGQREPKILTYEEAAKKCETFFRAKADKLAKLAGMPVTKPAIPSPSAAAPNPPGLTPKRKTEAERMAAAIACVPD